MHLLPAQLVLHGVERGADAGTGAGERIREVVHRDVLQPRLVAHDLVPVVPEVGGPELDVRGMGQEKQNRRRSSAMDGQHNIRFHREQHLLLHRNRVNLGYREVEHLLPLTPLMNQKRAWSGSATTWLPR